MAPLIFPRKPAFWVPKRHLVVDEGQRWWDNLEICSPILFRAPGTTTPSHAANRLASKSIIGNPGTVNTANIGDLELNYDQWGPHLHCTGTGLVSGTHESFAAADLVAGESFTLAVVAAIPFDAATDVIIWGKSPNPHNTANEGWSLKLDNNRYRFWVSDGAGANASARAATVNGFSDSLPHVIVGTFNGVLGRVDLYIDGILQATGTNGSIGSPSATVDQADFFYGSPEPDVNIYGGWWWRGVTMGAATAALFSRNPWISVTPRGRARDPHQRSTFFRRKYRGR